MQYVEGRYKSLATELFQAPANYQKHPSMKKALLSFFLIYFFSQPSLSQQTVGVFLNDSLSVNGYTLFSNSKTTYLIDNCGIVVNTWESNYSTGTGLYLLEDGNLLRSCRVSGAFSGGGIGGRIELFNWEGDLLWSHNYASADYHHHHDIEPLPNGNILILAWEARTKQEAIEAGRDSNLVSNNGVWPEQIVEVEMVGNSEINIVWEWHLWDHLIQDYDSEMENFGVVADHPELVNINFEAFNGGFPNGGEDWIHANSIAYNPELDQIAISSRHFSEIWIIDHSTNFAEAAGHSGGKYGKGGDLLYRWGNPQSYDRGNEQARTFWGQHNMTWIMEEDHPYYGKLLVYNNGITRPAGSFSSIDIWTPPIDSVGHYTLDGFSAYGPDTLDWTFTESGFFSPHISGVHALPNGNLFICEGIEGRFFEITIDKKMVWEYINPVSPSTGPINQGQPPNQNSTFRATRYPVDYLAFEGRDMTPGNPVELNPIQTDCVIYDGLPVMATGQSQLAGARIRNNPIGNELSIVNEMGVPIIAEIFNMNGKKMDNEKSSAFQFSINANNWPNGMYVLHLSNEERSFSVNQKFVKN